VPLATQTIEVLGLLRRMTGGGEFLFPGEQGGTMRNRTILLALKRIGMTSHGFRGLANRLLREQGWPDGIIELQLAHGPRDPLAVAYNHAVYLEPRARMMQAWADFLGIDAHDEGPPRPA
jgi:integrase